MHASLKQNTKLPGLSRTEKNYVAKLKQDRKNYVANLLRFTGSISILCDNVKESVCYYKCDSHSVCSVFTSWLSSSAYISIASSYITMGMSTVQDHTFLYIYTLILFMHL